MRFLFVFLTVALLFFGCSADRLSDHMFFAKFIERTEGKLTAEQQKEMIREAEAIAAAGDDVDKKLRELMKSKIPFLKAARMEEMKQERGERNQFDNVLERQIFQLRERIRDMSDQTEKAEIESQLEKAKNEVKDGNIVAAKQLILGVRKRLGHEGRMDPDGFPRSRRPDRQFPDDHEKMRNKKMYRDPRDRAPGMDDFPGRFGDKGDPRKFDKYREKEELRERLRNERMFGQDGKTPPFDGKRPPRPDGMPPLPSRDGKGNFFYYDKLFIAYFDPIF
jgi:hypothetical protein